MARKLYEIANKVFEGVIWAWMITWITVTFLWLGSWIFGSGPANQYVVVTALVGTVGFAFACICASIDAYLNKNTKDDLEEEDY